jgi:hypothetical protein
MHIDRDAPVQASASIDIVAHPEAVWSLLTDLRAWPSWNPDVKKVTLEGPVAPGTVFTWKAGGSTITSRIESMHAPNSIVWTGGTRGIDAVHVWRIEEHGARTRVITEESWSGLFPRLMPGRFTRLLQRSLEKALTYLEAELDRRGIEALFVERGGESEGGAGEAEEAAAA